MVTRIIPVSAKNRERINEGLRDYFRGSFDRFDAILARALEIQTETRFPLQVYPRTIREYIEVNARSIFCSYDLLAVPLLGVAGAAIGRAGKRLRVKRSHTESSCLWVVAIAPSSDGKTPALRAVSSFYEARQKEAKLDWLNRKEAYEADPEGNDDPGPFPQLFVTDTTLEGLRYVLSQGPALYLNDELSVWCHQMSQYKGGNADKPAWTSFWSHASVSISRKGSEPIYLEDPFAAVAGTLVPESVPSLNHRGHGDDGFVHRMLIAYPSSTALIHSTSEVPKALKDEYDYRMSGLFDPGGELRIDEKASLTAISWLNNIHYPEADGPDAEDWLKAKYKKLGTNLWRIALILHELRRVAEDEDERAPDFDPLVIDTETIERAIQVVCYFKEHLPRVQDLFETKQDESPRKGKGRGRPSDKREQAKEWLAEQLEGGPLPAVEIWKRAEAEYFSERTLKYAKKELGVRSSYDAGRWIWYSDKGVRG